MSIQTDLTRIKNAKSAIKAAIEGKGVTVPDATMLDGMAALIDSIEAGGGSTGGGTEMFTGTFVMQEVTTPSAIIIPVYLKDISLSPMQQLLLLFSDRAENQSSTQYVESLIRYIQYVDGVAYYNEFIYGYNRGVMKAYLPYFNKYRHVSNHYECGMKVNPSGFNGRIAAGVTYHWYVWGDNLKQ